MIQNMKKKILASSSISNMAPFIPQKGNSSGIPVTPRQKAAYFLLENAMRGGLTQDAALNYLRLIIGNVNPIRITVN